MTKFSQHKIKAGLEQSRLAANPDKKGEALEDLASELFEQLKGISVLKRNVFNQSGSREYDIVLRNDTRSSDVYFLDPLIFVECKNTSRKTDCRDVSWFVQKVAASSYRTGILVSAKGITGKDLSHAHSEIIKARETSGVRILILTENELRKLKDTKALAKLIAYKWEYLCVFDKVSFC